MERNGESASKNHYVRRLARITEKKNGGIPPFYGCLQQNCQKIKTVISIFSFYLVKSVRTVRTAKMAHMRIGL